MAPSPGKSPCVPRSNDTASVPRSRHEARDRLRREWLQSAQISALDSIAVLRGCWQRRVEQQHALIMLMRENRTNPDSCGKGLFCCSALARLLELSKV